MFLSLLPEMQDLRLNIIKNIISSGKELWLLGCGEFAHHAQIALKKYNITVKGCCVDDTYYRQGMLFDDMPVERLSHVLASPRDRALLITIFSHEIGEIKKKELEKYITVYYCDDWYNWYHMDYAFLLEHAAQYERLYQQLGDELSKKVLLAYFQAHITGDSGRLCELRDRRNYQYDFDLMNISADDRMVDCGAYRGDTVRNVISYVSEVPAHIVAFEPDMYSCEIMSHEFSELMEKGVMEILPYG